MARKKLQDLAKIGLGLAAAYGASKVLGKSAEEKGLEIARSETRDMTSDESIAPRKAKMTDSQRMANQAMQEDASRAAFASKAASTALNPKTGIYGEPGSLEGFRASESARMERIGTPFQMSAESPKAKLRARLMKASKGGSVVARGNKLARSKPTKLY